MNDWTLDDLADACLNDDRWDDLLGPDPDLQRCREIADGLKMLLARCTQDLIAENTRLEAAAATDPEIPRPSARDRQRGRRYTPAHLSSPTRDRILRQQAAMVERNTEVKGLIRDLARASGSADAARYREMIRQMAVAIDEHRQTLTRAPDEADHTLWRILATLSVPVGATAAPVSLQAMLDDSWDPTVERTGTSPPTTRSASPDRPASTTTLTFSAAGSGAGRSRRG